MTENIATFRVAALQMVSTTELEQNLAEASRLISQAVAQGAQLVVLPEYFCLMGQLETNKLTIQEPAGSGPIQDFLADQASRHGIWLIGGTVPISSADPNRVLNTTFVFAPNGEAVARYDKIHLFHFVGHQQKFDETRTICAGNAVCAFDAPFGRVGLSICYDLRFPELYRALGDCALLVAPSAFTYTTGRAHWELLLRARAVENQCYMLAAAQGGRHQNGRRTWGHSMLVDPWGKILAIHKEGLGVVIGDLELSRIKTVRQSLPMQRQQDVVYPDSVLQPL